MDIELEREKIRVFIKTGLCVMSALLVIMLLGLGVPKFVDAIAAERKLPIYCAPATEAKVALTFDGAWGNEDTRTILDILASENVKATFFFTGGWMEKYPDDIRYISEQG